LGKIWYTLFNNYRFLDQTLVISVFFNPNRELVIKENRMNEITLNNNTAECIKEISNFGNTVFVNICNGTETTVLWGTFNYVLGISVLLILFIALVGVACGTVQIFKN